jgi:hypothetical protein
VFLGLAWVRIPQNTTSPSAHIGFEFSKGTTACVRRVRVRSCVAPWATC